MEYDHEGIMKNTVFNWFTIGCYLWTFISVVAGIVSLAKYLYKHLQWVA